MTSIGKFAVNAASATQESTLALANINFDFSLLKMEAPIEYTALGSSLSKKRRREAEGGSAHFTARKLGALFADDLPHIPNLSRAYGLRVSEIAENPKLNPRGTVADGPFGEHVGADGTSIWAAATSGRGAMEVHLLACLLARAWSGPEATSIWSEIVFARRAVLQGRLKEQHFHIGLVSASQIEVDRERLSEWDASARAWLRTADAAMKTRQTQLMLIIDNVKMPLVNKTTVYQDVMDTWIKSMTTMENLVSGVPQRVQSADALLGLCAWHLYPDMCALGKVTTLIEQKDTLLQKGGLLTIGLFYAPEDSDLGISWSMPLQHLRYYGKPVMSYGVVGSQKTRVTFDRILQVAIGSMVSTWDSQYSNLDDVSQFLVSFGHALQIHGKAQEEADWPTVFSKQAKAYISSSQDEQTETARYVALGRRRYGTFLGDISYHPPSCFGLSDPGFFLNFQSPEDGIATLRSMAQKAGDPSLDGAIIQWVHTESNGKRIWEYASLVPQTVTGSLQRRHRRWLTLPEFRAQTSLDDDNAFAQSRLRSKDDAYLDFESEVIRRSITIIESLGEPCGFLQEGTIFPQVQVVGSEGSFLWSNREAPRSLEYLMDRSSKPDSRDAGGTDGIKNRSIGWQMGHSDHEYKDVRYRFLLGDASTLAIFHPSSIVCRHSGYKLSIDLITQSLSSGRMNHSMLYLYFMNKEILAKAFQQKILGQNSLGYAHTTAATEATGPYYKSLCALARASEVYTNLPKAEIDLNVVLYPLCSMKWAENISLSEKHPLTRAASFACVAMFDTGVADIDVELFDEVIAISSANHIYASEVLFCDPGRSSNHTLRHVTGNIGKPGLALLLSPGDTILREPDLETWELVNHANYDGQCEDHFAATSLHLRLTGYEQPLNLGRHGGRDKEVFYVEAVISVHDQGTWMADLDLLHFAGRLQNIQADESVFGLLPASCEHDVGAKKETSSFANITSIDNWYEFLDGPDNTGVVRARGNWVARLALAATPLTKKQNLVIASEDICWACVKYIISAKFDWSPDKLLVLC